MGREHMNKPPLVTFGLCRCPETHSHTIYSLNLLFLFVELDRLKVKSGNAITEMRNLASWVFDEIPFWFTGRVLKTLKKPTSA